METLGERTNAKLEDFHQDMMILDERFCKEREEISKSLCRTILLSFQQVTSYAQIINQLSSEINGKIRASFESHLDKKLFEEILLRCYDLTKPIVDLLQRAKRLANDVQKSIETIYLDVNTVQVESQTEKFLVDSSFNTTAVPSTTFNTTRSEGFDRNQMIVPSFTAVSSQSKGVPVNINIGADVAIVAESDQDIQCTRSPILPARPGSDANDFRRKAEIFADGRYDDENQNLVRAQSFENWCKIEPGTTVANEVVLICTPHAVEASAGDASKCPFTQNPLHNSQCSAGVHSESERPSIDAVHDSHGPSEGATLSFLSARSQHDLVPPTAIVLNSENCASDEDVSGAIELLTKSADELFAPISNGLGLLSSLSSPSSTACVARTACAESPLTDETTTVGLKGRELEGNSDQDAPCPSTSLMCPFCCRDDVYEHQLQSCHSCGATSCFDCLRKWIQQQPSPQLALETPCIAKCGYTLEPAEIKELVGAEEFERMGERALRNLGPPFYYCPIRDCPYIGEWHGVDEEETFPAEICDICSESRCILCGAIPFHKGATCEEAAYKPSLSAKDLAKLKVKPCPNPSCGHMISKEPYTCNKMMCICGHKFCFKCGVQDAQCSCTSDEHTFWDNIHNTILLQEGGDASGADDCGLAAASACGSPCAESKVTLVMSLSSSLSSNVSNSSSLFASLSDAGTVLASAAGTSDNVTKADNVPKDIIISNKSGGSVGDSSTTAAVTVNTLDTVTGSVTVTGSARSSLLGVEAPPAKRKKHTRLQAAATEESKIPDARQTSTVRDYSASSTSVPISSSFVAPCGDAGPYPVLVAPCDDPGPYPVLVAPCGDAGPYPLQAVVAGISADAEKLRKIGNCFGGGSATTIDNFPPCLPRDELQPEKRKILKRPIEPRQTAGDTEIPEVRPVCDSSAPAHDHSLLCCGTVQFDGADQSTSLGHCEKRKYIDQGCTPSQSGADTTAAPKRRSYKRVPAEDDGGEDAAEAPPCFPVSAPPPLPVYAAAPSLNKRKRGTSKLNTNVDKSAKPKNEHSKGCSRKPSNRSNCDSSGGGNGVSSLLNTFGRGDASRKCSSRQLKNELVHGAERFGHKAQGGGCGPGGHPAGHPAGNSDGHSRGEDPSNSTADVKILDVVAYEDAVAFPGATDAKETSLELEEGEELPDYSRYGPGGHGSFLRNEEDAPAVPAEAPLKNTQDPPIMEPWWHDSVVTQDGAGDSDDDDPDDDGGCGGGDGGDDDDDDDDDEDKIDDIAGDSRDTAGSYPELEYSGDNGLSVGAMPVRHRTKWKQQCVLMSLSNAMNYSIQHSKLLMSRLKQAKKTANLDIKALGSLLRSVLKCPAVSFLNTNKKVKDVNMAWLVAQTTGIFLVDGRNGGKVPGKEEKDPKDPKDPKDDWHTIAINCDKREVYDSLKPYVLPLNFKSLKQCNIRQVRYVRQVVATSKVQNKGNKVPSTLNPHAGLGLHLRCNPN